MSRVEKKKLQFTYVVKTGVFPSYVLCDKFDLVTSSLPLLQKNYF